MPSMEVELIGNKMEDLAKSVTGQMAGLESKLLEARRGGGLPAIDVIYKEFLAFKRETLDIINELRAQIEKVESCYEDMEVYSRKSCLLLHGVEENNGEDVASLVVNFINNRLHISNYRCDIRMIDNVHRLGRHSNGRSQRPRPIIIKFCSYLDRKKIWLNKRSLKGTGYLLTESLTRRAAKLYSKVKDTFGKGNVWTDDGRVRVLLPSKKKLFIRTEKELDDATKELEALTGTKKKTAYLLRSATGPTSSQN